MVVSERIAAQRENLSPAERRVAESVLTAPEAVAFGTVAALAEQGRTSGATVVRLARRLGFDGFVELQAALRDELLHRAAQRIRQPVVTDVVGRTLTVESENLHQTLDAVDRPAFRRAVKLLSSRRRAVHVLAGDASTPIAELFATELSMLRPGVRTIGGAQARVQRLIAQIQPGDVAVAIDIRRYERETVRTAERARTRGAEVVALTDSRLSPLAANGTTFVATTAGAGPFDSHIGLLAVLNALTTGVAAQLRASATERLDRIEAAWQESGALLDL